MNKNTLQRKINALGLNTRIEQLHGGGEGLFISLEKVVDGSARTIDRATEGELFKYLKRYNIPYEYRGNYTSLFIKL